MERPFRRPPRNATICLSWQIYLLVIFLRRGSTWICSSKKGRLGWPRVSTDSWQWSQRRVDESCVLNRPVLLVVVMSCSIRVKVPLLEIELEADMLYHLMPVSGCPRLRSPISSSRAICRFTSLLSKGGRLVLLVILFLHEEPSHHLNLILGSDSGENISVFEVVAN